MMDLDGLPECIDSGEAMVVDCDDPVLGEIPVFLNHLQDPPNLCGEIYVLLNTLRQQDRPYGDQGQISSVQFDEANRRLRMEYILNSRSGTYDPSSTHALRSHSLIAKPTVRDSHAASYCMGVMSEGMLTLVPVAHVVHVRPCFEHIDEEAASRKSLVSAQGVKSEESASKPLTGKSLHYQQLVGSIRSSKSSFRHLDYYEYDSVEASDLVNKHIVVSSLQNLRDVKTRQLDFSTGTQDQYLTRLSTWAEKEGTEMSTMSSQHSNMADLGRVDFSRQVELIMKRVNLIKFSDLVQSLPPNTRARYSESDILAQLDQCAICIQGVWVVLSHASCFRPQVWDTRDALLILLHAGRDVTVQLLSGINNLGKDEIEEIVKSLCSLDLLSNTWKLKLKADAEFTASHPEILKRHESVAASIISRLRMKKDLKSSEDTSVSAHVGGGSFTKEEVSALAEVVKEKLVQEGSLTTEEVKQALQAKTRDHFVSEAAALEVLRVVHAIPIRERWAVPSRGMSPAIDELRLLLISMFKERDAFTKAEIVSRFPAGGECDLTDHDLRKLIKEFAHNDKGYWVFRGEMIAERRPIKSDPSLSSLI